jgi:hypothetical protein
MAIEMRGGDGMADVKGPMLDWTTEEEYWRGNYTDRPYTGANRDFEYWRPAYRYGSESADRYRGRQWQDVENDLRTGWDRYEHRGTARTTWEQVKDAVRDAWNRVTGTV